MKKVFERSYNDTMQNVIRTAEKVASSELSVMIIGEHGTGKEWLARAIHRMSARANDTFYPVDCAALPANELEQELFGTESLLHNGISIQRGAFEEAGGGTLFLNEVGSLPTSLQMKISRALEYKVIHRIGDDRSISLNTRVIASLSENAEKLISDGTLQKDMFYRISPIIIEIPSLRERREDIPLLIEKFLLESQDQNREIVLGITPEALHYCLEYHWPGNVRQLKNAIEYAGIMCSSQWIQPDDLPNYLHNNHAAKPLTSKVVLGRGKS